MIKWKTEEKHEVAKGHEFNDCKVFSNNVDVGKVEFVCFARKTNGVYSLNGEKLHKDLVHIFKSVVCK